MRAQFAQPWIAVLLVLVCYPPWVAGQNWYFSPHEPCDCDFDWQWFAPIHDYCAEPNPPANEGYFFEGERSHWWLLRPDRKPIGNNTNPNALVPVWIPNSVTLVYGTNPTDASPLVIPIPGAADSSLIYPVVGGGNDGLQLNAIDDAFTETSDGWGWRYTLGHICDDVGWIIAVIPEAKISRIDEYGFDDKRLDQLGAAQGLDGIDGIPDPDGTGPGTVTNPVGPVAGIGAILPIDGLLTVPVFFNLSPGFANALNGFPDHNGNGLGTSTELDPDVPEDNVLTRIAVVFDDLRAAHEMRVTSVEAMFMQRKRRLYSGFDCEAFLGARYLELDDRYAVVARGGALADTDWDNNCENRIVGPQIGFRGARQNGRWTTSLSTRFMAGANFLSIRQNGTIGSHLPVGAAGVPIALGGNTFFHRVGDELFSPVGEFRFELGCQLTRYASFKVGWNGVVAGGVSRAANTIRYEIPQMGIERRQEDLWAHALSFGVEINR